VQGVFTVPLSELRERSSATLPAAFGPIVAEPAGTARRSA
jgi:phosphoribosylformylglycinamidine synthase